MTTLIVLSTQVQAADLSKTLWTFVEGKAGAPTGSSSINGDITSVWLNPKGLNTEQLIFVYSPQISQEAWGILLRNPKNSLSDYLGTKNWQEVAPPLPTAQNKVGRRFFKVKDGLYKGLTVSDTVYDRVKSKAGTRFILIVTEQGVKRVLDVHSGQ